MKKKWIPKPDEFFIGYLPEAPEKTSSFLKWVLVGTGTVMVMVAMALVAYQRPFSSSQFDYGSFTTLDGHLFLRPVPHLKVSKGIDAKGQAVYENFLLVGYGKAGAEETLTYFEEKTGPLTGKHVRLSGQLIHGRGKALFQLSKERPPELTGETDMTTTTSSMHLLDAARVTGEIVDPKCYFGVMKPGEGKPHRSCAVRCIAGGIPPVLHAFEKSDYFLLLDENLHPVNQLVLDIVGDRIQLSGEIWQWDDWKILVVPKAQLKQENFFARLTRNLAAMEEGITQCGVN